MRQTFKSQFCGRSNCKPEQFEELVFKECLPFHARVVAPFIRRLSPHFFDPDFQLIRYLGEAKAWRDARTEIVRFQDERRDAYSFLRHSLRLRVSGRKATVLTSSLLRRDGETARESRAA